MGVPLFSERFQVLLGFLLRSPLKRVAAAFNDVLVLGISSSKK